jgi:predicted phage-related endonuclease
MKMFKKPTTMRFETREDWLLARTKFLGASEVSALFGVGFITYYQMWMEKTGAIEPENLDTVMTVICGEELEAGVANVIRRVKDYTLRKTQRFLIHGDETTRLSCSLDYELLTEDAGWVPAELKVIDWMSLSDQWEETEDAGVYDPPIKYSLQLQEQLLITGKPYGYLFAMVGNKQLIEVKMDAEPTIQAMIMERSKEFWASADAGIAPSPDIDKDLAIMLKTMTNVDEGRELHFHGDDWWESRFLAYKQAANREKGAKEIKDTIRAEVLEAMGPAIRVKCTNGTVGAKNTDRWGATRRDLRITPKRNLVV